MKKINIVTGHYGSGKTNFSANLAIKLAENCGKVTVVDLDIVNPYFRSADFGELFSDKNIELIAPLYANSNLDIPAISFDLERIASGDGSLVIDVGGDDAGAMNCRRFLTRTAGEALELMYEIEAAAQMKHTAIVNNTNLLYETTAEILEDSAGFAEEISERSGLPIAFSCVPLGLTADVPSPFPVEIYVKKVWEKD